MSLRVENVWQQVDGTEVLTKVTDVKPGDRIVIRTGGMIPLDGRVVEGEAMVNQSSLTGESMPGAKRPGSPVYAGTVAEEGECVICVEKVSEMCIRDRFISVSDLCISARDCCTGVRSMYGFSSGRVFRISSSSQFIPMLIAKCSFQ